MAPPSRLVLGCSMLVLGEWQTMERGPTCHETKAQLSSASTTHLMQIIINLMLMDLQVMLVQWSYAVPATGC